MKSLQQVIHAVQYELDCSVSELSRKLGKSRNYLSTTMKNGLSKEKEQQLIEKLLELVDDENAMLRNVIKEKNNLIDEKQSFIDNLDNERNDLWCYKKWAEVEIKEKNDLLKIKQSVIDHQDSELEKYTAMCDENREQCENCMSASKEATLELKEIVATKDLFIDGQDEELKGLRERVNILADKNNAQQESIRALCSDIKHSEELVEIGSNQIDRQQKTINSLKEVSRELGLDSQALSRKNRILTGALISMGLLWAVSAWVMS